MLSSGFNVIGTGPTAKITVTAGTHADSNSYSYGYIHTYSHGNCNSDTYGYCNTYTDSHAYGDTGAVLHWFCYW